MTLIRQSVNNKLIQERYPFGINKLLYGDNHIIEESNLTLVENSTATSLAQRIFNPTIYGQTVTSSSVINKGSVTVEADVVLIFNDTLSDSFSAKVRYVFSFNYTGSPNVNTIIGTPIIEKIGTGGGTITVTNTDTASEPNIEITGLSSASKSVSIIYKAIAILST